MRGWVYVITNRAMPSLVKIGFSRKDPELRAKELYNTGTPFRYEVKYEMLVKDPRLIESKVHAALSSLREDKEWFNCSVIEAINTIRNVVGGNALLENIRDSTLSPGQVAPQNNKIGDSRISSTLRFAGTCSKCGTHFKVTLNRGEKGARCPNCMVFNHIPS